jgi:TPR repeat protein
MTHSPALATLLTLGALASGCLSSELVDTSPPKQAGKVNPLSAEGAKSFEQRQRDCWEMPNAAACYEVGMSYELGTNVDKDVGSAHEYYAKACEISDDPEHCSAADRMAAKTP